MEKFYEHEFSSYQIVPSLTIWSGPGWGFKSANEQIATFVLGPLEKNYDYSDKERFQNLAIHEFGHSFVNDVVLENASDIIEETQNLFLPIKESMIPQGYSNWETCVNEHFVRAGEIIVPELMGDSSISTDLLQDYTEKRKFTYLSFIVDKMKYYRIQKNYSFKESVRKALIDVQKNFN